MKEKKLTTLAKIAIVAATIIWGSSFIIVKDVTDTMPTSTLLAIRFLGASILLSLIFHKNFAASRFDVIIDLIIHFCGRRALLRGELEAAHTVKFHFIYKHVKFLKFLLALAGEARDKGCAYRNIRHGGAKTLYNVRYLCLSALSVHCGKN